MSAKALLVGCNYPGTPNALPSPVLDATNMRDFLIDIMGFPAEEILMLVDDGEEATEENFPSKENIEAYLSQVVQGAQAGDSVVFYFSGHGTQVPSDDDEEPDGADEAICASDDTEITDDDLRAILSQLPEGVKFTMISDSCHSGTLLDQTEVVIEGPKEDDPPLPEEAKCACHEKCACSNQSHRKCIDICEHLSNKLGCEVHPGNIRVAIACAEQDKCSAKYKSIWDFIQEVIIPELPEDFTLDQLFCAACEQVDRSVVPRAGKCGDSTLPEGAFTLISGCAAHETSADTGNGSALTMALIEIVKGIKEVDPEASISSRTVVSYVREVLAQAEFEQNPCLECCEEAADEPFLWCPTC